MQRNRNPFVRLGRPPMPKVLTPRVSASTQERQGPAPSDSLQNMGLPARAFSRGGRMPFYHDDPNMCRGGKTKR